ncbi:MAG: enoyl-CoA hydratase/isomerase family protein [Deltaproteobacteria bacterium]|nr:enoyl-CoA hydratase/isomerase family protein [Deltaproteobacteria bacterium]MBW1984745.1 enoyl-CoA hydratase/isomerase family protein [Deltaproteobacteria bacterium]
MSYKYITIERKEHIAVVTLNRPEKLNALSFDLMKEIEKITEEFQEDTETRVVIFKGEGKHFSAGRDLADVNQQPTTLLGIQRSVNIGPRMIRKLFEMDQITIAAIHGTAVGGAACIVSALDFRIGTNDCNIGYPEAKLGMSLSWASLPLCVHLIGPARAKQMVILAQKIDAQTLLNWGFLDEITTKSKLMESAYHMAEAYAAMPPIAAQMIKKSVNAISSALDQSIMHMDSDQVLLCHTTNDLKEGIQAFLEKRKGKFTGN